MLIELTPRQYESVRSMFEGFDYSLSIHAAIEGNNPGRIFVDDPGQPRTAFALTVEGYLLTGDHDNPTTNRALRRFLRERIFSGEVYVNGDTSMSLAVHPEAWEARLAELIPTHEVEKLGRYHYLCRRVPFDWREHVPEGYTVRRLNRTLLEEASPDSAARLHEWIDFEEMWGTVDSFLDKGVGFCVLHGDEPIAWCVSDCVARTRGGQQVDVGIYTHPDHRRKGLATAAVVASVEHCLSNGFSAVGWHCNADNVGSWKTAEKAGFTRNREYAYYYYMYDEIDQLAELGWHWFKKGEYRKTAQYYEQVFAQRDENPDYYYHLAAIAWATIGDADRALKYLNAAADRGWPHVEYSRGLEAFSILRGLPEWEAVLARMEEAG